MNRTQTGQVGAGVTVEKIQPYRSDFLDSQIRQESFMLKGGEVPYDALQQIQVAPNEPSDTGINAHLNTFWNAWRNGVGP
jgi:flagellar hook-associated protein FlgK